MCYLDADSDHRLGLGLDLTIPGARAICTSRIDRCRGGGYVVCYTYTECLTRQFVQKLDCHSLIRYLQF
jgi:hypothetical protein